MGLYNLGDDRVKRGYEPNWFSTFWVVISSVFLYFLRSSWTRVLLTGYFFIVLFNFFLKILSYALFLFSFSFIFLNSLYLSNGKHEGEKFVSNRSFLVPYF